MGRAGGVLFSFLLVAGCAAGSGARGRASPTAALARGGTLDATVHAPASVMVRGDMLIVWVSTEVPEGSRLQAAYAMVDALARAELLKYLEVTVQSSMRDELAEAGQAIELLGAEIVRGAMRRGDVVAHGWAKIHREDEIVLRVVGRLEVGRDVLAGALEASAALRARARSLEDELMRPRP